VELAESYLDRRTTAAQQTARRSVDCQEERISKSAGVFVDGLFLITATVVCP